jgi:lysophospholipase L1-like esterase
MEIAAQIVWRLQNYSWFFRTNRDTHFYRGMFEPHPYLVVVPKPAVKMTRETEQGNNITISHNSLGFRGQEVTSNKPENIIRIAVLGGSTTYCVSISDDQTWPFLLEKELGPGYEVINLGVPGYSTVENLIQTALILPSLNPDVAIFYVGWNDVRNAHIADLKPDYSNFHGKTQYYNLRLDLLKVGEGSLLLYHAQNLLRYWFTYEDPISITPTEKAFTDSIDQRALYLFGRNVQTMISLCRRFNIAPFFVPQILNYAKLDDKQSDWTPYLKNKNLKAIIQVFNDQTKAIARQENVAFVDPFAKGNFASADFLDEGHFNAQGNEKFAVILASYIKKHVSHLVPRSEHARNQIR